VQINDDDELTWPRFSAVDASLLASVTIASDRSRNRSEIGADPIQCAGYDWLTDVVESSGSDNDDDDDDDVDVPATQVNTF